MLFSRSGDPRPEQIELSCVLAVALTRAQPVRIPTIIHINMHINITHKVAVNVSVNINITVAVIAASTMHRIILTLRPQPQT